MMQAAIPVPGEPIAVALAPVMEATDAEVLGGTEADQDIDVAAELPSVANPEPAALENGLEQQPNAQEPEPETLPRPEPDPEPAGPPRRGWWRRRGAG